VLRAVAPAEVDLSGRSRKTQLEAAGKKKARVAVVVDAAAPGQVEWLDLRARSEQRVDENQLEAFAREKAASQGDDR
jgi:histidyl-tRNA synthetase